MRVVLSYGAVGRGGDAVQLMALAGALRTRGHEVLFVGPRPIAPYAFTGVDAQLRGVTRKLPWWARDLLELTFGLMSAVRVLHAGRRADVIIHRAAVYDFSIGYVARFLSAPLILHLDAHVASERSFHGEGYWRRLHAWAMRRAGQAAAIIVTPSEAVAAYYRNLGLPAERMVVHRNCVSERHLRMGTDAARTHPPCMNGRIRTIGFVGSLSKWHGVDLLLEAMRLLNALEGRTTSSDRPGYRLLIIGRGSEYERLREYASYLGLDHIVEWRGALPHDDAVLAMREFDVAVLPNTLATGAPMKLAEYAAMARPIIAPDYPNIRDMFAAGAEILLFQPCNPQALAEAIRGLAEDSLLAQRLGRAAWLRVQCYTWEGVVESLLARSLSYHTPEQETRQVRARKDH